MSFFSELQRRNVFRVALLYVVASWIIMQVADVGISLLGLPVATGRLVFLLLAIGLPLVLLFSWAYEITPEGLKKEKEVDRTRSVTHQTAKKLDVAVIVLLVFGIGALALDRFIPEERVAPAEDVPVADTAKPEGSIAVLPFVNMSADEENGYFSDGLSEELLNLLARIPELKVAARTSAFRFKDSDAGIAEIARQLNVAHVLEGSVRKSGSDIRITAQLINAADGYHLWSHTWDRTLTDVFAIQDEIAAAVVDALRISLLGEIPHAPKTDTKAFELYLRAKQSASLFTRKGLEQSIAFLTEALAIDPEYAEAWAELARAHTNMAGQTFVAAAEGYSRAEAANKRALTLDPRNAKALANLAWIAMYRDRDFAEAVRLLAKARSLEPSNPSVLNTYAVLNYAFARGSAAISLYNEALSVDPLAASVLANLTGTYINEGQLVKAQQMIDRLHKLESNSGWVPFFRGLLAQRRGHSEAALDYFKAGQGPSALLGVVTANFDLGRDAESDAALEELKALPNTDIFVAVGHAYRGQSDEAFAWLERAYDNHDASMIEIRMFKFGLNSLHGDPRWTALLEKLGITDETANTIGL
jgi:TolB-like protein/Tfp pilus assembly protein PilF